jgi:pimeloyl-ACP methyl ester carboxylesterase
MFGLGYLNVQAKAAELTTSVVYDRAGTGWSDAIALPRSAAEVVEELRTVLRVAGLPAPYVLVAHSLGAVYARRFAQLYPAEVAGLLLLDPAHEDYSSNEPEVARRAAEEWKNKPMPDLTSLVEGYRVILNEMYEEWPPQVREALIERQLDPSRLAVGVMEGSNIEAIYQELRNGGPIPNVPMIVLTAMGSDAAQLVFSTPEVIQAQNEAKLKTAEAFVRSTPGAENRVLQDASHVMLHTRRPDAVIQGVRDLLKRIG